MPGFLPATRPLSETYGPDVVDDKPIEDPEREAAAETWNAIKHDTAYAARMTPLLRLHVVNTGAYVGAPIVDEAVGPEGFDSADVTLNWTNDGVVEIDLSNAGIVATRARVQVDSALPACASVVHNSSTSITVHCAVVLIPAETDLDFTIWIY